MLNDIHIRNLGVIEEATAEFSTGLTVVTGETGAGKTMVVTSLRLLSGHRAEASRVRAGADKAVVEGIFATTSAKVADLVEEIGGFMDATEGAPAEVIASRTVTAAGRSRAHLAGKAVAAAVLGQFAGHVITIHGQNDQLRLLDPARQLRALDTYAGLRGEVASYREKRRVWQELDRDLRRRTEARRELALETETLQRALETIDEIDPQPGEDEQLKADITRLQDADEERASLGAALSALDGSADVGGGELGGDAADLGAASASDLIGQAQAQLTGPDPKVQELAQRLGEVAGQISDIAMELGEVLLDIPDPDALEGMLQRQAELRELRKFAVDVDGAIQWRDRARQRLEQIDVSGDALDRLAEQVERARAEMMDIGRRLSTQRANAAKAFAKDVTREIRGLHMSAAVEVEINSTAEPGPEGLDEVEFQLVQGGHRTALAASASGGELSRVMLALEVIMAGSGRTMVFDEVDAGVGGKAAVEIGRRLAALATKNQVIVVTHLPQVAAFADAHLYVAKAASDATVSSSVRTLSEEERVEELSRMLAGLESDTGRAHAEELVAMATDAKRRLDEG
ncbi:DNA repair protein RecN [Corynebacterium heidelbergense]|uniref:DNA repair protein RecN n=1 Tax=Corynebacterium heidelbergense TaxID=2055947 RepID=A0A364VCK2_9CORY|nr:DNA repair protein RecN [Corynebacterium heidelbergense]RAV34350.1 DNA repair protein RecN [Corynebacterium heidelbergense]WCZ36466.1 DNA repair protein RecN [Corynebacterium heidelbergense]